MPYANNFITTYAFTRHALFKVSELIECFTNHTCTPYCFGRQSFGHSQLRLVYCAKEIKTGQL